MVEITLIPAQGPMSRRFLLSACRKRYPQHPLKSYSNRCPPPLQRSLSNLPWPILLTWKL